MNREKYIITEISANGIKVKGEDKFKYYFVIKRIFHKEFNSIIGYSAGDRLSFILKPFFLAFLISYIKSIVSTSNFQHNFLTVYYGIIVWIFISESIKSSIKVFQKNRSIILKTYLPKYVFIYSLIYTSLSISLIYIIFGMPLFLFYENSITLFHILNCLLAFILLLIIILNLCFGLSVLCLKYRLIRTTTEYLLFSLFFTLPITFNYTSLGDMSIVYLYLNPIGAVIALNNSAIHGITFDYINCYYSLLLWLLLSLYFLIIFYKNNHTITEKL